MGFEKGTAIWRNRRQYLSLIGNYYEQEVESEKVKVYRLSARLEPVTNRDGIKVQAAEVGFTALGRDLSDLNPVRIKELDHFTLDISEGMKLITYA